MAGEESPAESLNVEQTVCSPPQATRPISDNFKKCLHLFENSVLKCSISLGPSISLWKDKLGRLKVVGGNLGAHQSGQASLDFRLRNSSHIRLNTLQLLDDLCRALEDFQDATIDPEIPEHEKIAVPTTLEGGFESEVHQLYWVVCSIINDLFQMAMLVRNPSQHSRLTEEQPTDINYFEPFDVAHVRDKFPHANEVLVHRLGVALTRRRKYLKYQERHHAKLSRGLVDSRDEDVEDDSVSDLSETVAATLKIGERTGDEISRRSKTSFASTFLREGNLVMPQAPQNALDGSPFERPYCHYIIVIADNHSWVKHVFDDLKPYSCIALDCTTPHKLDPSQHDWTYHLNTAHGKSWSNVKNDLSSQAPSNEEGADMSCPLCLSIIEPHV